MTIEAALKEIANRVIAFKPTGSYEWFEYTLAKPLEAKNSKGRTLKLSKGEKFGMRRGNLTGTIKLVKQDAMTNTFTCDEELAEALSKHSKAVKAPV